MAEANFQRNVRHWRMHKRVSSNLETEFSAVPSDYLEAIRWHVTTAPPSVIEYASPVEIMNAKTASGDTAGRPTLFSVVNSEFQVYPTPNQTYTSELLYYSKIPILSDSNTSNWLLEDHPDLYLYASLQASAPYLMQDERITLWNELYLSATQNLIASSETARSSGSLRMRVTTY
ncbi:MAG: hypothetical protein CMD09_03200 [Flavobacteriales bacterium]|nr:hypothetical protein [Flavobacteriales bacterium]